MQVRIDPAAVGVRPGSLEDLLVESPRGSAEAIRSVLAGQSGPRREVAVLNAAAALFVGGKVKDLQEGVCKAGEAIDSGRAAELLSRLVGLTAG